MRDPLGPLIPRGAAPGLEEGAGRVASAEGGASGDTAVGGRLQASQRGEIRTFFRVDSVGAAASWALGANRVCRFVVAGENGVRACPKSGQKILSDCVISCVGVLVVATGVAMREPGRLTKVSRRVISEVC